MAKQKSTRIGQPVLKKLVVGARYKPTLRAYEGMDRVGIALSSDFPDWQRAALGLRLFNKQKHRQLVITFNQSSFDCITPDDEEINVARRAIKAVGEKLQTGEFSRFGVRCWHLAESTLDSKTLVELVHGKFCLPLAQLEAFSKYELEDAGYAVDLSRKDWTFGVRVGPMQKDEWLERIEHDRQVFQTEPDGETYDKYVEALPKRFVCIDIDVWCEGVGRVEGHDTIRRLRTRAAGIAQDVSDYLRS